MGQESSGLNCRSNGFDQKKQITQNIEINDKKYRVKDFNQQILSTKNNLITQTLLTQNFSLQQQIPILHQQTLKQVIFVPQHQSITKVSEFPFPSSFKKKGLYVQQRAKSLVEIVQARYNTSKHLPYSQVLGLVESLAYGLAYIIKKKCNHHDFYPTNIYYINGVFKIINPLQVNCSSYSLTSQRSRFSFLSPELILSILEQRQEASLGEEVMNKADVFAIGMILLEVCSLQPSSQCYDEASYNIIDSVIRERLAKVAKIYTPIISKCIQLMLEYETQRRIDPIFLAQLIHSKIENQKTIALQRETQKPQAFIQSPTNRTMPPSPHHGIPSHTGPPEMLPHGLPPGMMIPQQMMGPPPYVHQPFKMQSLNEEIIAVTTPNEQFTRIGPNNQGFLSTSTLQQKLRVISSIKQHPKQQDEDLESKLSQSSSSQVKKKSELNNEKKNQLIDKEKSKPIYPFVQSIYTQKPLSEGFSFLENSSQINRTQPLVNPLDKEDEKKYAPKIQGNQKQILPKNDYFYYTRGIPGLDIKKDPSNIQQKGLNFYKKEEATNKNIIDQSSQKINENLNYQPPLRNKTDQGQKYVPYYKHNLIQSNEIKNLAVTKPNLLPQSNTPFSYQKNTFQKGSTFPSRFETSFQSNNKEETIDQRVQRVLSMSKNAK